MTTQNCEDCGELVLTFKHCNSTFIQQCDCDIEENKLITGDVQQVTMTTVFFDKAGRPIQPKTWSTPLSFWTQKS